MDTNEPGREPTEPTDAMILAAKIYEWQAKQKYGEETLLHVAVLCDFTGASRYKRAMAEVIEQHMMSGARPMPDTPAPDEQDATLVKLIDLLTRTANAVKGQPGEMKQHGWADLPELCTALTARVAELEAVVKAAVNWHCATVRTKPYREDDLCDAIGDYLNAADTKAQRGPEGGSDAE